jgi:uncharacterized radical SAM superfamily protein
MEFYYPGKKFPALSVTGDHCALNCPHCQGRYLHSMVPAEHPEKLIAFCEDLEERGGIGCLISGGCDARGTVPLPYSALRHIMECTDLIINVHTGFIDEQSARALRDIGPHYISYDVPTPSALYDIYELPHTQENYLQALTLVEDLAVVPHVMVGLNTEEEISTLCRLWERGVSSVVLLVCMPTPHTPSDHWTISMDAVTRSVEKARSLFSWLQLGCMRPRWKDIEEMAPLFDAVAVPTPWARETVHSAGIQPVIRETCCVVR